MTGGKYHLYDGIYLVIYLGMLNGINLLDILLIPWYIPWYIAKVVYTTFGVVYTMTQPSRCPLLFLWTLSFPFPSLPLSLPLQAPSFPPSSLGEQISVPGRQLFQSSLVVSVCLCPSLPPSPPRPPSSEAVGSPSLQQQRLSSAASERPQKNHSTFCDDNFHSCLRPGPGQRPKL